MGGLESVCGGGIGGQVEVSVKVGNIQVTGESKYIK